MRPGIPPLPAFQDVTTKVTNNIFGANVWTPKISLHILNIDWMVVCVHHRIGITLTNYQNSLCLLQKTMLPIPLCFIFTNKHSFTFIGGFPLITFGLQATYLKNKTVFVMHACFRLGKVKWLLSDHRKNSTT